MICVMIMMLFERHVALVLEQHGGVIMMAFETVCCGAPEWSVAEGPFLAVSRPSKIAGNSNLNDRFGLDQTLRLSQDAT